MDRSKVTEEQYEKKLKLETCIKGLGSLAVGFSGGVDSTFLLAVAHEVLGEKALAITQADDGVPGREVREAEEFCKGRGIRQVICHVDPLQEEEYRFNGPKRCYVCKRGIFSEILRIAKEEGIEYVAEGSNMDDLGDYRPGLQAVAELHVTAPLREAGLSKADIRALSRAMELPTWDKPAYACLATRFSAGEEITKEKLHMVEAAEQFLIDLGFKEERVRVHGDTARIEVPEKDIERLAKKDVRDRITEEFKKIGFVFVSLDLSGYRMGNMNRK